MIAKASSIPLVPAAEGVTRRVIARGGKIMAVEVSFRRGAVGALHSHPHEQVGYVVKGRFTLEMDGQKDVIAAGDSYYAPPGVPHGVVALEEDSVLLDVFTPQREDFLA